MNREIKFRAWDKSFEMMYEVDAIRFFDELIEVDNEEDHQTDNINKYEVMQYTGLKDKNGTDIYEGDILSTDLDRPYLIVEFRNGAFMFQCHDNGKDYYDFMATTGENSNFTKYHEVIGNIYEHSYLLEQKKTSSD